jgi:hypothetical protein
MSSHNNNANFNQLTHTRNVKTKYDSTSRGWCSKEVVGPFKVGAWKYMRGEMGPRLDFGIMCGVGTNP